MNMRRNTTFAKVCEVLGSIQESAQWDTLLGTPVSGLVLACPNEASPIDDGQMVAPVSPVNDEELARRRQATVLADIKHGFKCTSLLCWRSIKVPKFQSFEYSKIQRF